MWAGRPPSRSSRPRPPTWHSRRPHEGGQLWRQAFYALDSNICDLLDQARGGMLEHILSTVISGLCGLLTDNVLLSYMLVACFSALVQCRALTGACQYKRSRMRRACSCHTGQRC